ncbi:MAG: DUF2608 domain-containing protein, partial [Chlamydiota bacterium]
IVEEGTEKIIQELQQSQYCVMGLTTQGLALATRTAQQLKEAGIKLSLTAPSEKDVYLYQQGRGVLYRKGILFTAGTAKGEALFKFLEIIGYMPKRIVFINDKEAHLADVEKTAQKLGVEFLGLRYAYSDRRKALFCPKIAEFQFANSTFSYLLTDEEAREKMNNHIPVLEEKIRGQ